MSDRVTQVYPYYLPPQYRALQPHAICKPAYAPAASTNPLAEIVREQGLAIKALQKAITASDSTVQGRDLIAANDKTATRLAGHDRALTFQTGLLMQQQDEIRQLQHDSAVLTVGLVALVCAVLGRMLVSALFKRTPPTRRTANQSHRQFIATVLGSAGKRT